MDTSHKQLIILRSYLLLNTVNSLIAVFLLGRAIRLEGSGSLFGLSGAWIGFVALTTAAAVLFIYLSIKVFRESDGGMHLVYISKRLNQRHILRVIYITGFLLYSIGSIFLFSSSPVIYGPIYPVWLVPFFFWLFSLSLLTLLHLAIFQDRTSNRNIARLVLLLLIITSGILVNLQFWAYESPRKEDVYFTYLDGGRLLDGLNPYERILTGNMRVNDKYSTYLPIFYYLSSGTQWMGLSDFSDWLSFWRIIFLIANLSIAALLFYITDQRGIMALSLFASLFWLFNRWTLHVSKTADIDFLPLFLMLVSLYLYQRHTKTSFLILGLSLGIKQMAIFLVPLYLIWVWMDSSHNRVKNLFVAIILIGIIPLVASMPFLAWNWEGFYKSILFSATRDAAAAFDVYSLDAVLGLRGIPAKIPMLIMLAIIYWLTWKYKIYRYTPAMLAMAVFVFFNSVIFTSYMVWVVALIPLVAHEYILTLRGEIFPELHNF
jgi:hypothetical protein